jgi:hypothetical protein
MKSIMLLRDDPQMFDIKGRENDKSSLLFVRDPRPFIVLLGRHFQK